MKKKIGFAYFQIGCQVLGNLFAYFYKLKNISYAWTAIHNIITPEYNLK